MLFNATPLQFCFAQLFYLLLGDVTRRFSPVLDNNEITYLTSSVGQMSTTSVSFSISLSIAAII